MDPKDDNRSIDWAPEQIRKLQDTSMALNDRISQLGESLNGTDRDFLRLRNELERMSENFTQRLDELDRRIKSWMEMFWRGDRALNELARKVTNLERGEEERAPEYSPPIGAGHRPERLEEIKTKVRRKYQPDLDDELDGIPDVHGRHTVGGVVRQGGIFAIPVEIGDETKDRITAAKAMRQEAYDRGFAGGKAMALDEAESRVRAHLGKHWSTEATEGIISALRGTKPIKDNPQA